MANIFRYSIKGIIIKDGKVLVGRVNQGRGEFYKLPGGGHHFGETVGEALVRECQEELGLNVKLGPLLFVRDYLAKNHAMEFDDANFQQTELMFLCLVDDFSTLGQGHEVDANQELFWKTPGELAAIKFMPQAIVPFLKDIENIKQTIYLGDVN